MDLSAGSMTSVTSVGSADTDGSREFMDVLQVRRVHDTLIASQSVSACLCKDRKTSSRRTMCNC